MTDQQRQVGRVAIQLNGNDLAPDVAAMLDEVIVEDDLLQPAMFSLRFNDPKHTLLDGKQFALGTEIKIGAASTATAAIAVLLVGELTALEPIYEQHNQVVVLRGYDRSHRLHRGSKTRTFLKQTDSDIASQIARENGLKLDVESSSGSHEYVIQANQTDMQFLRARAVRIGFQVSVEAQKLVFRRAEAAPPAAQPLAWGTTLLAFRARLTAASQVNEVHVRGWDAKAKRALVGKAKRAQLVSKIGDATTGAQAAERAFGAAATMVVSDQPVRNQGEADTLAQSMLDHSGSDYVQAEGTSLGSPTLRAGTTVELKGIGERLAGTYFVTATRHRYTSREGYETHFFVNGRRPNGLLNAIDGGVAKPTASGVVVGIVTNVNDPDKQGCVKLKFPWLDEDHESDWARLVAPGAGDKRGLYIVPEVDDEVLVAFEHGDIGRPYVIGGLWNGKDAPPVGNAVQNGKTQVRILKTRAGHSITITDTDNAGKIDIKTAKHTVTLDDSASGKITVATAKHTLTLDDTGLGKITLQSGGDVELKGSGGKLAITSSGVELSSQSTLKIQANATLDLKSSAILNIQGSLVKIN